MLKLILNHLYRNQKIKTIVTKYLNEQKDLSNHDKVEFNVIEACFL